MKSTTNYREWARCFRRRLWKEPISQVYITEGKTVLNTYVKKYFDTLSVPIIEFNFDRQNSEAQAKIARNTAMIQEADMVVACVDELTINDICGVVAVAPHSHGKQAVILHISNHTNNKINISENIKKSMEVKREELITVQQELALIKRVQQFPGECEDEKEKLILANSRFVRLIAEKYASEQHTVEKLIQEGNKGILYAVNKFDETKGYKFISFAIFYVKESIKQFIANKNK